MKNTGILQLLSPENSGQNLSLLALHSLAVYLGTIPLRPVRFIKEKVREICKPLTNNGFQLWGNKLTLIIQSVYFKNPTVLCLDFQQIQQPGDVERIQK